MKKKSHYFGENLQQICNELEEQIKDLEVINKENEDRQSEWEDIK
jgi:hypothetical protein